MLSVTELAEAIEQEQSIISHNIKAIIKCNILTRYRMGKKHILTVNMETAAPLFEGIENYTPKFCAAAENAGRNK